MMDVMYTLAESYNLKYRLELKKHRNNNKELNALYRN